MKRSLYDYCQEQGNPALLQQWDVERNGTQTPENLTFGSHQKVWWRCERGHEWQATVNSRAEGAGCPVCANKTILPGENDLASRFPDLVRKWTTALEISPPALPVALSS